jgi:hypothetical protein
MFGIPAAVTRMVAGLEELVPDESLEYSLLRSQRIAGLRPKGHVPAARVIRLFLSARATRGVLQDQTGVGF